MSHTNTFLYLLRCRFIPTVFFQGRHCKHKLCSTLFLGFVNSSSSSTHCYYSSLSPTSVKRKKSRGMNDKDKNKNSRTTINNLQTVMPHLHHDIWFDILSWLSATFLYSMMSGVCYTWATIIRDPYFVDMHLSRSRSGLFIQDRNFPYVARCLET